MNYYCFSCAPAISGGSSVQTTELTASDYQLEKFMKHTAPTALEKINSVFKTSDFATYRNYVVNSAASGCLEVDDRSRHNYIFFAGESTGATFSNGSFVTTCNAVKLVLPYSSGSAHAFPVNSTHLLSARCARCGTSIAR